MATDHGHGRLGQLRDETYKLAPVQRGWTRGGLCTAPVWRNGQMQTVHVRSSVKKVPRSHTY